MSSSINFDSFIKDENMTSKPVTCTSTNHTEKDNAEQGKYTESQLSPLMLEVLQDAEQGRNIKKDFASFDELIESLNI